MFLARGESRTSHQNPGPGTRNLAPERLFPGGDDEERDDAGEQECHEA